MGLVDSRCAENAEAVCGPVQRGKQHDTGADGEPVQDDPVSAALEPEELLEACCRDRKAGLEATELFYALNAVGLYPREDEIQSGLECLGLALPVQLEDFGKLEEHLEKVGCMQGPKAIPHARRGMQLRKLFALHAALVDSGWLQKQCINYNSANAMAIRENRVRGMREDAYAVDHFVVQPVTSPDAKMRDKLPSTRLHQLGLPVPSHSCSYAQLVNPGGVRSDLFVSHYWGMGFTRMLAALSKSAMEIHDSLGRDKPQDVTFWLCLFALNQHQVTEELSSSLEAAPFDIALMKASAGMVILLGGEADSLTRTWCLFEVLRAHETGQPLRVVTDEGLHDAGLKASFHGASARLCDKVRRVSLYDSSSSCTDDRLAIWFRNLDPVWRKRVFPDAASFTRQAYSPFFAIGRDHFTRVDMQLRALLATPLCSVALQSGDWYTALMYIGLGARSTVADFRRIEHLGGDLAVPVPFRSTEGRVPLTFLAAYSDQVEELDFLLERGLDPDQRAHFPFAAAAPDELGHLLNKCELHKGSTPLAAAARQGNVAAAKLLLDRRADVNARSAEGFLPLSWACVPSRGSAAIASLLLEHRATLAQGPGDTGCASPLHAAAFLGNDDVLRLLLGHAADVRQRDAMGRTPLHAVAVGGQATTAAILLEHHAELNATKKVGSSPLHCAASHGHVQLVTLLLAHRADASLVDAEGRTAARAAADKGLPEIEEILRLNSDDRWASRTSRWLVPKVLYTRV